LKLLLDSACTAVSHLKHLWLVAGYEGRGKSWAEEVLGLSVQIVRRPPKPIPEEVARAWAKEWAKEGQKSQLAQADAATRLRGIAEALGSRAHLFLAGPEQKDEQGLREVVRNKRSVRLCSDDASDGEAIGSCISFSKQFLERLSGNSKVAPFRAPTSLRNGM
jgi:hypothetical protein